MFCHDRIGTAFLTRVPQKGRCALLYLPKGSICYLITALVVLTLITWLNDVMSVPYIHCEVAIFLFIIPYGGFVIMQRSSFLSLICLLILASIDGSHMQQF